MLMRTALAFLCLLPLSGCGIDRDTSGHRADLDLVEGSSDRILVEKGGSVKTALKIEGSRSRAENRFLVVEVQVRNTSTRNYTCEWRTTFQDADGFDIPVTSNPWSPVTINANQTVPLRKTSPSGGAEKATFYIRESAPIRK